MKGKKQRKQPRPMHKINIKLPNNRTITGYKTYLKITTDDPKLANYLISIPKAWASGWKLTKDTVIELYPEIINNFYTGNILAKIINRKPIGRSPYINEEFYNKYLKGHTIKTGLSVYSPEFLDLYNKVAEKFDRHFERICEAKKIQIDTMKVYLYNEWKLEDVTVGRDEERSRREIEQAFSKITKDDEQIKRFTEEAKQMCPTLKNIDVVSEKTGRKYIINFGK